MQGVEFEIELAIKVRAAGVNIVTVRKHACHENRFRFFTSHQSLSSEGKATAVHTTSAFVFFSGGPPIGGIEHPLRGAGQ